MDKLTARAILSDCNINVAQDFFTLSSAQVECLLDHADTHKYRKPKNANGSRGRYFHAYVQRKARGDAQDVHDALNK